MHWQLTLLTRFGNASKIDNTLVFKSRNIFSRPKQTPGKCEIVLINRGVLNFQGIGVEGFHCTYILTATILVGTCEWPVYKQLVIIY